jgi:hypothetical protein
MFLSVMNAGGTSDQQSVISGLSMESAYISQHNRLTTTQMLLEFEEGDEDDNAKKKRKYYGEVGRCPRCGSGILTTQKHI